MDNIDIPLINVNHFITSAGVWDEFKLRDQFPSDVANDIGNIPLPTTADMMDKPSWVGSGSGKFYVVNCYAMILNFNYVARTKDKDWQWIWKLKLPNIII